MWSSRIDGRTRERVVPSPGGADEVQYPRESLLLLLPRGADSTREEGPEDKVDEMGEESEDVPLDVPTAAADPSEAISFRLALLVEDPKKQYLSTSSLYPDEFEGRLPLMSDGDLTHSG